MRGDLQRHGAYSVSDPKKSDFDLASVFPWIIAGVLGYYVLFKQDASPAPTPDPKPVTVTLEKATSGVLATMKAENARVFSEAASKVENGEFKNDKELFAFVEPATKTAREQANKPFDLSLEMTLPRNDDGSFAGKEIEAGKVLRRVAKSW
jgi:hypothetical protein